MENKTNRRRRRLVQFLVLLVVQTLTLLVLSFLLSGFQADSLLSAAGLAIVIALVESAMWWVFIEFLANLPTLLYPLLTFFLTALAVWIAGNFIPGIYIRNLIPALILVIVLTVVNAVMGSLLSVNEDAAFDRNVTQRIVKKYGNPQQTDVPGFLYLEIDGLSIDVLREAMANGHMPTLKHWLEDGSHTLMQWETDFSSQTGAMQIGILHGNNEDVPAYRWWDRGAGKLIMSGDPRDAVAVEARLSNGKGLLAQGGASRGNMFSGDASESLFTISAILKPKAQMGPGFYTYLLNPFVVVRLTTRFVMEVITEWVQAAQQQWRVSRGSKEYHVSARNPTYAFLRSFIGPLLQDMTTYAVIGDLLRGVPAVYALYAGYDDLGHFTGMRSHEAFHALAETDRYFARIKRALRRAPRPYHIIVLSDHGQSIGPTFQTAHGVALKDLVEKLVNGQVYAAPSSNEARDTLNAVLNESTRGPTRSARLIKRALASRTRDGVIDVSARADAKAENGVATGKPALTTLGIQAAAAQANIVVLASGSTGLVYLNDSKARQSYEQIQAAHPNLISGLVNHPGVGFVVVKSETRGTMAIGSAGTNFVDEGAVEGKDPLSPYGPHAVLHVKRESSFVDTPDLIVNTKFDPQTEELCGFENQVSHHGGLGGPQNRPFVLYPTALAYDGTPVMWASNVYKLLHNWRVQTQGLSEVKEG